MQFKRNKTKIIIAPHVHIKLLKLLASLTGTFGEVNGYHPSQLTPVTHFNILSFSFHQLYVRHEIVFIRRAEEAC